MKPATVPQGVRHTRALICKTCPSPCPPYLAGNLPDHHPCFSCPIERWSTFGFCLEEGPVEPRPAGWASIDQTLAGRYRAHWTEFHELARDGRLTPSSLADWERRIPAGECACRRGYAALKAVIPPRWDNIFPWTVDIHNGVNRKLNRKELTQGEAARIWSVPTKVA